MARASKAQSEITAATILEIAADEFARLGYARVSLNSIAQAAGVTRGAVYHHYANKQALFEAVVAKAHADVAAAIDEATPDELPLWEQLERGSIAFLRASTQPGLTRILLVEGPAVLGWDAWRRQDHEASQITLIDVLSRLALEGEIDAGCVGAAASLLSGAMNEAALWLAREGALEEDFAQAEKLLIGMIRSLRTA